MSTRLPAPPPPPVSRCTTPPQPEYPEDFRARGPDPTQVEVVASDPTQVEVVASDPTQVEVGPANPDPTQVEVVASDPTQVEVGPANPDPTQVEVVAAPGPDPTQVEVGPAGPGGAWVLGLGLVLCVAMSAGCTPVRIKLEYRVRQPSPEHAGRVVFGTLTDERRNPREVAPDVTVAPGTPSMPVTIETMIRQGLAFAGFAVVPEAPLRIDARLHTAWAAQTFYNVQANLQLTVSLVEVASGHVVWTNRFGVVESSGGADARTNHQAAYKKALSRLAASIGDAFAASTFAEAAAAATGAATGEAATGAATGEAPTP